MIEAEAKAPGLTARVTAAIDLARQVGRAASAFRDSGALNVENKGLQDFVTIADRQAEETIRTTLARLFPDDGFMGEEGGGTPTGIGFWVVDPIDGTTNYIRGFRHWGVSMAYVADGEIRIGVIYDAALDKVYSAVKGQGAFKDGQAIRASSVTDPAQALVILGHSRRTDFAVYQGVSQRLYGLGIDYRRMGAAAIGLVRVADGIADLYYEQHLNGWDMMAGALIAREAGAMVAMPPLAASLSEGGPIIAGAAGLAAQFAFLADIAGPDCVALP
ncbi:MAG: inositol monophosphatase protein [Devosia sp.]|nr:inositol monophosphatase protein [Devosia sp.]